MLKQKNTQITNVDIKMFGVYHLFMTLLKDEFVSLQKIFGKEISDALLTTAMFRWAFQAPIKRMQLLHSHDFCSCDLAIKGLNDKKISNALKKVGENRNTIIKWMRERLNFDKAETYKF